MKTSKKMLSLLLIAAMLVSVLCMGVSASDTTFEPVSISEGEPANPSRSRGRIPTPALSSIKTAARTSRHLSSFGSRVPALSLLATRLWHPA